MTAVWVVVGRAWGKVDGSRDPGYTAKAELFL